MDATRRLFGLAGLVLIGCTPLAHAQPAEVLRTAQVLVAQGAYADAAARLEAVAPEALTPDGAHLLGRCYQAMLQHGRAVAAFEHADTSRIIVLADWGRSLERLGQPEEAEARYRAAYRKDSTNQTVAASLARLYADRGRWGEVAAVYRRLLDEDPDNSYLHAQLGTAYTRLDSVELAIIHYERAHGLNPRSIKVVLALTKVYYDVEYYMSAKRVVDRALDIRPRSADLWRRRGEIALKEEEYPVAHDAFSKTLDYGDSTALDLRNLGVSRYLLQNYEDAETVLLASYRRDSTDVMNAFYLGMAKQQFGAYEEALFYLNHAADLLNVPMLADIHARIGNTYVDMARHGDAGRAYRLALNLAPDRTEILFQLATLYDAYYADKNAVMEAYERFLAQVPEELLPQMQQYAEQRVEELREELFFKQGRTPRPALDSSAAQQ